MELETWDGIGKRIDQAVDLLMRFRGVLSDTLNGKLIEASFRNYGLTALKEIICIQGVLIELNPELDREIFDSVYPLLESVQEDPNFYPTQVDFYISENLQIQPAQRIKFNLQTPEEKKWFDFSTNQIMTIEGIIRSAFANPDRDYYATEESMLHEFCHEIKGPEYFLDRLKSEQPKTVELFDSANLTLAESVSLYDEKKKAEWETSLSSSRWYGPFKNPGMDAWCFHSVSEYGEFTGIHFLICFPSCVIMRFYCEGHMIADPVGFDMYLGRC